MRVNADPLAEEASGNYARIVEDDEFVTGEEVRELGKQYVLKSTACAFDEEQAGGVAAIERSLGDQTRRQVVLEVVYAHGTQL